MKKALTVLLMLGLGATQAAEYRGVASRGLGADEHTFEVEGLLIRGHQGLGRNQAQAISSANNDCYNSGHVRCKIVSCSRIDNANETEAVETTEAE